MEIPSNEGDEYYPQIYFIIHIDNATQLYKRRVICQILLAGHVLHVVGRLRWQQK
jgi:hypothetical protein